jgi:SAM-dependent methyltransferase
VTRAALRAEVAHFLRAWPLQLGRAALRAVEAAGFATLPPLAGRVLDLGCGDGAFGARVAPAARRYGVDTSPDRLRLAAGTGALVVRADAAALPYPAASLDAVIANSTLEHLPDPAAAVREVARVLRPGGRFAWTVPVAAVLDNLHFAGVAGYRDRFTAYWEHATMLPAAGWADLVGAHAPALRPLRRVPLESPRQTAVVDLLTSVRAEAGGPVALDPALAVPQREGFADLIADLLTAPGPAGDPSVVLFEHVRDDAAR